MKSLSRPERGQVPDTSDERVARRLRQLRGNAALQARLAAEVGVPEAEQQEQAQEEEGGGFFSNLFDSAVDGIGDLFELVDDKLIDPVTDFLFGEDDEQSVGGASPTTTPTTSPTTTTTEPATTTEPTTGTEGGTEATVTPVAAEHVATDAESLVRSPPPELASTGEIIPVGTMLVIVSEAESGGRTFVEVEGEDGTAWGWTLGSNLSHRKAHDPEMAAEEALSLTGLSGTDLSMAQVYNSKGAYLAGEADHLGVQVEDTAAVLQAESGGAGFGESGDMIIRFENHIFYDRWGASNPEAYSQHFQHSSGQRWTNHRFRDSATGEWDSFHGDQSSEWRVLEFARTLDDTAALLSISMGAAQIMGFNYESQGFASVQEMFEQMNSGIRPQLDGLFTFIANNPTCLAGLRSGNYVQFAGAYNGSGQAEYYGGLIETYASSLRRTLDTQGIG